MSYEENARIFLSDESNIKKSLEEIKEYFELNRKLINESVENKKQNKNKFNKSEINKGIRDLMRLKELKESLSKKEVANFFAWSGKHIGFKLAKIEENNKTIASIFSKILSPNMHYNNLPEYGFDFAHLTKKELIELNNAIENGALGLEEDCTFDVELEFTKNIPKKELNERNELYEKKDEKSFNKSKAFFEALKILIEYAIKNNKVLVISAEYG